MDLHSLAERIDAKRIEERLRAVTSPELQLPQRSFVENLSTIGHLVALPHNLLALGYAIADLRAASLAAYAKLVARHMRTDHRTTFTEDEVQEEAKRLQKEHANEEREDSLHKRARPLLESITDDEPEFGIAVRTILLTAISLSWTSFECAVKDCWVACLNGRPLTLAQPAFEKLSDQPCPSGRPA